MAKKAKPKKRGVKPGTKRGRYRKPKAYTVSDLNPLNLKFVKAIKVSENETPFTPKTPSALCGQLEDAVMNLETRISNVIAKINSLM